MPISKFEYSQAFGRFAPRLKAISVEYQEASKRALKEAKDVELLKKDWAECVKKFRGLQKDLENLEVPKGYEEDGEKMVRLFTEYIDAIEEKSEKFGIATMKSGELNDLEKKETQASKSLNKFTYELTKKMFD
ncbi:hypothetical protein [Sporosarcina obsidiansis]|uniref:hypothetical protein n=1 Tax=Sporosarcina obsidiansis TaxID=2660748 RepID=UPI00129AEDC2|nr:hypothetical protein [Sporosarcina obsidiansis]